jgi:hypothetical protein
VGSKWFAGPNAYYDGTLNDILVAVEESGHIGFVKKDPATGKKELFFDHSIGLATLMLEMTTETGKTWQELSDEMWAFIKERTGQERIVAPRFGINKNEGAEKYYKLVKRLGSPEEEALRKAFGEKFEQELAAWGLPWKITGYDITDDGGAQFQFEGGGKLLPRKLFPRKSGTDGSVRLYVEMLETESGEGPKLAKVMRKVMDSFLSSASKTEIVGLVPVAKLAGIEIPTHPNKRYNLLVTPDFFANGELDAQRLQYADRFDLNTVSGSTDEQFVNNVLAKAKGKVERTVVLVPDTLAPNMIQRLVTSHIRVIRANAAQLLEAKTSKDPERANFQADTYAVMLLTRKIDKDTQKDSAVYRTLSFMIKSHFKMDGTIAVDDYIQALTSDDILRLVKGYLAYKPAEAYRVPDYSTVAAALLSA